MSFEDVDARQAEEQFFARLRKSLNRLTPDLRTPHPGPRPRPPWRNGLLGEAVATASQDARIAWAKRFATEWENVNGEVYVTSRRDTIGVKVADIVSALGVRSVLRTGDPRWDDTDVDGRLGQIGIEVMVWGRTGVEKDVAATAELGLTWAHGAAARTGTVLERSSPEGGRIASLLPPVHVVVVDVRDIVPDRGEMFAQLRQKEVDFRSLALISGPSRTGDIQNDLTVGVHGPKRAIALLVGVPEPFAVQEEDE